VVHLCFGYAAVVPGSSKPAGYSFLAELADTNAEQISIEAAQPKLDLGVLKHLSSKKIMLGVLDLGNPEIESADVVADRIRNGLKHVAADRLVIAPDFGLKLMPRHVAFGKLKANFPHAETVTRETPRGRGRPRDRCASRSYPHSGAWVPSRSTARSPGSRRTSSRATA